jgi:hypothetical protein
MGIFLYARNKGPGLQRNGSLNWKTPLEGVGSWVLGGGGVRGPGSDIYHG